MNLIGQRVMHVQLNGKPGKFGLGSIVDKKERDGKVQIRVKFDNEQIPKLFSYPECFERYLQLEDESAAEYINDIKEAGKCISERYRQQDSQKVSHETKNPEESVASVLAELDQLTGLDEVKQDIHKLSSFLAVSGLRKQHGFKVPVISKHLVLTGNPGTGKTTVARLIARIYHSLGVVLTDKFIETNRAGLVAGYVGQTAQKTQEVIRKALGGVLFIDEAYSLANDSKNDYGAEAIDTLISEMENHRDNLVVIVAGYEEPMKRFIEMNPGLSSRFNRYLHFSDYNSDALMTIFRKFCEDNEYILSEEAEECVKQHVKKMYLSREKDFGNARAIRNLFEKIITCQAERIYKLSEISIPMLTELTKEDVDAAIKCA